MQSMCSQADCVFLPIAFLQHKDYAGAPAPQLASTSACTLRISYTRKGDKGSLYSSCKVGQTDPKYMNNYFHTPQCMALCALKPTMSRTDVKSHAATQAAVRANPQISAPALTALLLELQGGEVPRYVWVRSVTRTVLFFSCVCVQDIQYNFKLSGFLCTI